jgi:hypothetical protein
MVGEVTGSRDERGWQYSQDGVWEYELLVYNIHEPRHYEIRTDMSINLTRYQGLLLRAGEAYVRHRMCYSAPHEFIAQCCSEQSSSMVFSKVSMTFPF